MDSIVATLLGERGMEWRKYVHCSEMPEGSKLIVQPVSKTQLANKPPILHAPHSPGLADAVLLTYSLDD